MERTESWPPVDADARDRLREQAMHDALRLRREAVDAFWRGTDERVDGTLQAARRAAERLAARLRQHAKRRAEPAPRAPTL